MQNISPWLSIWLNPRKAIRKVVTENQDRTIKLIILVTLVASIKSIDMIQAIEIFSTWISFLVFLAVLVTWVFFIILLTYIGAEIIKWTGKRLGGKAKQENIRAVIAWSSVPLIWSFFLWAIPMALPPEYINNTMSGIIYWIDCVLGLWSIVIFIICLSEIQEFSIWKSILNSFLTSLILACPVLLIFGIAFLTH